MFDGWQPCHHIFRSILMPEMQISTLLRFSKAIWPRFPTRWSHCISECSALQSEISIHLIRVLNALKCLKFQELASIFKTTSSIFSRPLFWQLHMVAPWCCHFHALQVGDSGPNHELNGVKGKFGMAFIFSINSVLFLSWTSLHKESSSFGLVLILILVLQKFALGNHQVLQSNVNVVLLSRLRI